MEFTPTRAAGLAQLQAFLPHAGRRYADTRNHDDGGGRSNVSQLSPWLHAGLLKEHEVLEAVLGKHPGRTADKFVSEVFWRVYFEGYLAQRPSIWRSYCQGRDRALEAVSANAGLREAYEEASLGRTGIEAFDHWARELVETGYLHNHARMWFASIWIFTLKLDWTLGADFFLRHLIDGDAASNTLSWRWVAGLHTKGKTYLARPGNIARYTANHPHGPLSAEGLVGDAPALTEAEAHARQTLALPPPADPRAFDAPYALILHDHAASHVPLALGAPPALVIGAARPDARSPSPTGAKVRTFALAAVASGTQTLAAECGCARAEWGPDVRLADLLDRAGVSRLVVPFLPIGWTRDALWPQLAPLADGGGLVELLPPLQRAAWPYAGAGFFGVRKHIGNLLREVGIAGA